MLQTYRDAIQVRLKQADYGVHHGYAIAEGNNQYDNAIIIKRKDNGKIIACVKMRKAGNYMILSSKRRKGTCNIIHLEIW